MPTSPAETVAAVELLEELLAQERDIQFDSFGYEDAWAVGSRLVEIARERELPVAISIVFGEQRVFAAAMTGSSADNDGWLERKFRVVRRYNAASFTVGTRFRSEGTDFDSASRLDPILFAAAGGAFPIRVRGSIVGIVGVSGLPEEADHRLVVEALTEHAGRSRG